MKKKLLFMPLFFFAVALSAQVKYWDFGAKELGAGYDNMMPLQYLNAFANYNRQIELTYEDQVYTPNEGYVNESGQSAPLIYATTFNANYAGVNFQVTSKGSASDPGGTLLSGGSDFTKPTNLPDLDGATDFIFKRDSNSDRIYTVRNDITRYDERTEMLDDVNLDDFKGCLQYTTPGEKRYNRQGGRGFQMQLTAGQYVYVMGAGQYTDIEGDGTLGFSTGYFQFLYEGTGTPVDVVDIGAGTGDPNGPIDNPDSGDESFRVMKFQAVDAGQYSLINRGGKIRVYRVYISDTDISGDLEALLDVDEIASPVSTGIKAIGNRVYVSNVTSSAEINIYSITGALVKSLKTDVDTNFEFKTGLWIATVKTVEGQKSVKFVTR
ncbi:T9SS type A sorting domain-containing protein [Flavisericum labens]|uniref:T9SS type A sorting domain-containing protein n=1 Tax=Flavisericum labens TaxID=3377112 RepID=UPI00387B2479